MDSVVLINKPPGITSGECVRSVKAVLKAKRAGHSGSLDGNASGVLLVALGRALKRMDAFAGLEKEYEAKVHFHGKIDIDNLKTIVKRFIGKVNQLPPRKSAVSRKPRIKEIYSLKIMSVSGKDIVLKARVQAGFYMRRLASDLGNALGVRAHLKELKRTAIGPYKLKDCAELDGLSEKDIIPLDKLIRR